jgi:chromosome segregation protein
LRLTKLELHGFKSFADLTQLAFEPGATMIVGPNGCGKSNVSDAVRWVLGEQRARALRGAKMEEVIFQGSSARRAVNVAEVSLHFDNSDSTLPLAFREVVITRRLSRSGESDYFLNRAPCRLRDIQDLVRGTGLGAESGVVIESKMIDALLSDRPDDRRELFEEAAGVGLYRDRRRSTERRLEETTVDLSRLDDLINEVTSQVRSLARQRKRAERHAELTARRFGVELTLASREMAAWAGELAELEGRLTALREQAPAALAAVQSAEQAREEAQSGRAAAEARRAELARMVGAQRQAVLQLEGEIKVAEERQRNAVARRQRADAERREGEAAGVRVSEDRARAADERAELEQALVAAADALQEQVGFEEEARGAVAAARAAVEQAERGVRELRDQLRRAELDRDAAGRELQEVAQRAAALDEERAQLADRLDGVRRECSTAEETIEGARTEVAATQRALEVARAAAKAARDEDAGARAELLRADQAVTSLQGKVGALEALERERVGLAPAAAAVLKARHRFGDGAILGPLSDFISAGPAAAALVERYLGPTVHAVVVRDGGVAEAVRGWHASARPGPLLLLPLDAPASNGRDPDAADLASLVDASGPARPWAAALLGHVRSVADGAAFVDARGAVFLPGAEGGPGPLRRRAELAALRTELETLSSARGAAAAAADAKRAALQAADYAATAAAEASNTAQVVARRADEHRGELERRRQRAERELVEAQALAERLSLGAKRSPPAPRSSISRRRPSRSRWQTARPLARPPATRWDARSARRTRRASCAPWHRSRRRRRRPACRSPRIASAAWPRSPRPPRPASRRSATS